MHSGLSSCDPNLFYAYSFPLSDVILDFFLSISDNNTKGLSFLRVPHSAPSKSGFRNADDCSKGLLKKGKDWKAIIEDGPFWDENISA